MVALPDDFAIVFSLQRPVTARPLDDLRHGTRAAADATPLSGALQAIDDSLFTRIGHE